MNRRLSMCLVFSVALAVSAGFAKAQETELAPLPPPMAMLQGPGEEIGMIGHVDLLGFEGMHGGKVVAGSPFSAVAISESTQTLADGNHITRKTQTNLFRDSQGRFRKEVTLPAIGPLATSGQPKSFVFIHDPVANSNYILHPDTKSAEKMERVVEGMRSTMHEGMPGAMHEGMPGAMHEGMTFKVEHRREEAIAKGNLKTEDLGTQTIAGVSAQGRRITHTIPAGEIGNEQPLIIVSEHWYSNDLQMTVMSRRNDPRFGETTYTLTNIQRSEPEASLFQVPSDYTVTQGGPGRHGNVIFRQEPPLPPPDN